MAGWEDVRRVALALPDTDERMNNEGSSQWRVADKLFVWERPLRRNDLLTHAVLARLDRLPVDRLEELAAEAWLARAPKRLASRWLADR